MSTAIIAQTISIHPTTLCEFWHFPAFSVTGNACHECTYLQTAALQVCWHLSTNASLTGLQPGYGLPSIPAFGGAGGGGCDYVYNPLQPSCSSGHRSVCSCSTHSAGG